MKRLFISIVFALPLFVSCLVDDADVNYIDSGDLVIYAKNKVAETVALPVEALELALAFDDYLKKTEEEKALDSLFAGNVSQQYAGGYIINISSDKEYRHIRCEFNTKGVSIREKDASWLIPKFNIYGNDFGYSSYDYNFSLPENTELVAVIPEEGYWDVNALIKLNSLEDGLHSWTVTVAGSEETKIGVKAYYGTSGEFLVQETLLESGEKTNIYSGRYFVDIRRDEEPFDYCNAIFNGLESTVYDTSR